MRLVSTNGSLIDQNSAEFLPNSANFDFFQQNSPRPYTKRKDFSKNFIREHKLTLANCSKNKEFLELSKNEKSSIRYYLHKKDQVKQRTKQKKPKTNKQSRGVLGLKLTSFLMLPTFMAEALILSFSYLFYISLGFNQLLAITSAFCVEFFFMATSGGQKATFQALRWLIYAFSVFTVTFSIYVNDPKVKEYNEGLTNKLSHLSGQLHIQKEHLKDLHGQRIGLAADMEVYRRNELITKGRKQLSKEKEQLRVDISDTQLKITSLMDQISNLKASKANTGTFSWSYLKRVEIQSWSLIIFLALIQFLSSVCTSEFGKSLTKYITKNKHKTRMLKTKGRYFEALQAHTYLN